MTSQKGRDFLLKIGNGADPEIFTALGAARTNAMTVNNNPIDNTTMENNGVQALMSDAGIQTMQFNIDGLFKDTSAEETLRTAAMDRTVHNFQIVFPNGDTLEANFVIKEYNRGGAYDGLETFSAILIRSGTGSFTAAV